MTHDVRCVELFDEAVFSFLARLRSERPWLRDRYEPFLLELADALDAEVGDAAPLSALTSDHVDSWLGTLDSTERLMAESALNDFGRFVASSGWVTQPPNDLEETAT